jgi:hypothetical protein
MSGMISIEWECVSDGKTEQGALFKGAIQELLKLGHTVQIYHLDASKGPIFTDPEEFGHWFESF